jgi:hypothetical protein
MQNKLNGHGRTRSSRSFVISTLRTPSWNQSLESIHKYSSVQRSWFGFTYVPSYVNQGSSGPRICIFRVIPFSSALQYIDGWVCLGSDCPQNHKSLMLPRIKLVPRKKEVFLVAFTFVALSRVLVCYGVILRGSPFRREVGLGTGEESWAEKFVQNKKRV